MLETIIVIAVLVLIIGGAATYLLRKRKAVQNVSAVLTQRSALQTKTAADAAAVNKPASIHT